MNTKCEKNNGGEATCAMREATQQGTATVVPQHSSITVRGTMDIFQHRYYKIPKMLMTFIGQWPYQTNRIRCGSVIVSVFVSLSLGIPVLIAAIEYWDDKHIVMDCLIAFGFGLGSFFAMITLASHSKKMLQMLDCIRADWLEWAADQEVNVLHEYAERGMKIITLYTVAMFLSVTVYIIEPIVPKIIDVVLYNSTKPGKFPIPVHFYHLDAEEHYFYIIIYTCLSVYIILTITTTYNIMILVYVQHGCAIFAAVGHMLERIGKNETLPTIEENRYSSEKRDRNNEHLICLCISRHNRVIEYVKMIERIYSWTFLVVMIIRTLLLSVVEFQIVHNTGQHQETLKFIVVAAGLLIYVYMESYVAHILSEHSISICYYIQNGEWYRLSLKAQKLLRFMLMRCSVPCQLTAGKVIQLSVESFVMFLKTSITYLTVLRSM